jgi:hypothetical protein
MMQQQQTQKNYKPLQILTESSTNPLINPYWVATTFGSENAVEINEIKQITIKNMII